LCAVFIRKYLLHIPFVSHTVHYTTINWRKVTKKFTEIVYLFLKCIYLFIYLLHRHVSALPLPSSGCFLYGTAEEQGVDSKAPSCVFSVNDSFCFCSSLCHFLHDTRCSFIMPYFVVLFIFDMAQQYAFYLLPV
jgi:hypothetical protein